MHTKSNAVSSIIRSVLEMGNGKGQQSSEKSSVCDEQQGIARRLLKEKIMRRSALITLFVLLALFAGMSFASEVNVFGPEQFERTSGAPDVYVASFTAIPGDGWLSVKNGSQTGDSRIVDALSSAQVFLNGEEIFGTSDFNQRVYLLEAPVTLADVNSLSVELGSSPGSYLTIEIIQEGNPTPTVTITANPTSVMVGESSTLSWTSIDAQSAFIDNGVGIVPLNGSTMVFPGNSTTYTISVTGPTGSSSTQATVTVLGMPEPQPEGSFGEQYEDLIPPDATISSYASTRFSLITGQVNSSDGFSLSDVSVSVHSHPEYGTAFTDSDGQFSIPVNGGTTMTIVYQKPGWLISQRKTYVPWNDIAITETIQMIPEDPASTTVSFDGNPDTVMIHESTAVLDDFGERSCSLIFTGDNQAYLVDEDGNDVHELTTITTRATEFTTIDSMPAILPSNSAYTYCVELSTDGAQRVRFDKPIIMWVDNFLGFVVGEIVPVGYYDRDRASGCHLITVLWLNSWILMRMELWMPWTRTAMISPTISTMMVHSTMRSQALMILPDIPPLTLTGEWRLLTFLHGTVTGPMGLYQVLALRTLKENRIQTSRNLE